MKALYFVLGLCLVVTLVFAASSADKTANPVDKGSAVKNAQAPVAKDSATKKNKAKDMTVQELADGITKVLDQSDEVMDYVPGFKQEKDPDGKEFYTYKGTRLEKVDKEKLAALYNRIRQERTRLNTERINRQLETIQQTQQAANIANQAARIPRITPPPAQVPAPPPAPPRAPPAPPPTPKR